MKRANGYHVISTTLFLALAIGATAIQRSNTADAASHPTWGSRLASLIQPIASHFKSLSGTEGQLEPTVANSFIAFASVRADDNYEIFLMNPDGSGVTRLTYLPADDRQPAVNRIGSKIAFISNRAIEADDHAFYDIYVMDNDGTNVHRVTTGGFAGNSPSVIKLTWNADGTKLAFSKFVAGVGHIYTVDVASRVLTDLIPSKNALSPDWSPDGTRIAFMRNDGNGYGLCIMNADGSNQVPATWGPLGGGSLSYPTWSPDGIRIAYVQNSGIGFADANTGSNKKLLTRASNASSVNWSPDGQSLAYLAFDDPNKSANPDIFLTDIANTQRLRLTRKGSEGSNQRGEDTPSFGPGSPYVTAPVVSSGRIAFIGGLTTFGVHTMNADGWDDRFIAPLSRNSTVGSETRNYSYTDPSFSRDGSKLVLVRATTVNGAFLERDIAIMDSNGLNERVIKISGNETLPQMSSDNSSILFLTDRYASGCSAFCTVVAAMSAGGDGTDVGPRSSQSSMVLDFDLNPNVGSYDPAFVWGGAYYLYGASSEDYDLHKDIHGVLQYVGLPAERRDNQSSNPINGDPYPPDGYFASFESPAWIAGGDRIAYIRTRLKRDTSVPGNVTQYVDKTIVSATPGAAGGGTIGASVDDLYNIRLPGTAQGLPQIPSLGNLAWSPDNGKLVFSHDRNIISTMTDTGTNVVDLFCPNILRPFGWVPASSGPLAPITTYTIGGTVRNAQNVALANATVNLSGGFTSTANTDGGGNYIFTALPAGLNYTVSVSSGSLNFTPASSTITNLSGDMTLNFSAAVPTPTPTPTPTATPTPTPTLSPVVQLSSTAYNGAESVGSVQVQIMRSGTAAGVVTVNYATSNNAGTSNCATLHTGAASSRCDYETTMGTVSFASGETSKTISIPLIDDSYAEGDETFTVSLSNAIGASLTAPNSAIVTIFDNETVNGLNPIAQPGFFVRVHYTDFLSREPDADGLAFWSGQITECGTDAICTQLRRINGSGAFFLSIEFQETGYLVYRFYKAGYGNITGLPVPLRLNEFLPDTQQIGKGVVVGVGNWQAQLEANKQSFAVDFVTRARFTTAYPNSMTPAEFVDALFLKAGVTPTSAEHSAAIGEFGTAATSADSAARARSLRRVAENTTLNSQEYNKAFVLMQYFGYLRRNPNDAPDIDFEGFNFWLGKLNEFNGNFINAEMVKAFITSGEYRRRFGTE